MARTRTSRSYSSRGYGPLRSGSVLVTVMIFLVLFGSLALALYASTGTSLGQSRNCFMDQSARLAAEGGLSYLINTLQNLGVSGSLRGQILLNCVADNLDANHLSLGAKHVSFDGNTISIPSISMGNGESFSATITLGDPNTLHLTVTGQYSTGTGDAQRTLQRRLAMDMHPDWDMTLGYGLCSIGPVQFGMNTDVIGVFDASDGSVYSEANGVAVTCGSGHISGDVSVSDPNATVSIGSTQVDGGVIYHAPKVTMPTIDRSPYKALAKNIMDSNNPPAGTYKNIIIPPGVNPTFNNNVTIQGVMYVQSPNVVTFANNCTFTGILVGDDQAAGSGDANNIISFKNNASMSFNDPNTLPSGSDFDAVKQLDGVSVLAPGFSMDFKNNLSSASGIMALRALTVKNNLDSTFYGSLLIYGPGGLDFKNNTDLSVNLSSSSPPAGFAGHGLPPLVADPKTYAEQ